MKKYIFTESQMKKVIDNLISEENEKPSSGMIQGTIKGNVLTYHYEDSGDITAKIVDAKGIVGDVRGSLMGKTLTLEYPKSITLKLI